MLLFVNSLAHFLVDTLSVATIFSDSSVHDLLIPVVLYNTFAFSTQCIVGLLADTFRKYSWVSAVGIVAVIIAYIMPASLYVRVCAAGLGNSLFHVGGGAITLEDSGGKAWKLGVFVAPGAFGVTLGTVYPELGVLPAIAVAVCAALICYYYARRPATLAYIRPQDMYPDGKLPIIAAILLCAAVAVRAVGGSIMDLPWKSTALHSFVLTLFVFLGKSAGGFVCDRIGAGKTALLSVPAAAILVASFSQFMFPSLVGQFVLNLSMPVTLWLLFRAMPDSPGFAFGLAASALWPGTIVSKLADFSVSAAYIYVFLSFAFALFAVLFAERKIIRRKKL